MRITIEATGPGRTIGGARGPGATVSVEGGQEDGTPAILEAATSAAARLTNALGLAPYATELEPMGSDGRPLTVNNTSVRPGGLKAVSDTNDDEPLGAAAIRAIAGNRGISITVLREAVLGEAVLGDSTISLAQQDRAGLRLRRASDGLATLAVTDPHEIGGPSAGGLTDDDVLELLWPKALGVLEGHR